MLKRSGGATYLFAAEMRAGSTAAPSLCAISPRPRTAEVIGENRGISVKSGVFKDDFANYGIHLYRITQ